MSGFRPRFFLPAGFSGATVGLDADDSHHVLRVLRLRPGDECEVVVGAAVYAATVLPTQAGGPGKAVRLSLGALLEDAEAGARYARMVVLVQALARPAAVDRSIEKSTEAGASLILLVHAAGSPTFAGKADANRQSRWARIAREAAKQSKQPAVPPVEEATSFAAALERLDELGLTSILLDPGAGQGLHQMLASEQAGAAGVALWIGPESGWTEKELDELLEAGVARARLGRGVLRTETAGPVAVAVARLALGDW